MNRKQFPELDALRAFAVTLVVWSHTVGVDFGIAGARLGGYHGVTLFFVISGFLITGILLDARGGVAAGAVPASVALRVFYIRRFLRIFPVYYAVLLVTFVLGIGAVRSELGWHAAYLSNWLFAFRGTFGESTAHLWSLAVEEQFYLVWPWFALLLPVALVPWAIGGMIVAGPLSRVSLEAAGANELAIWITTPTVLDSLGFGCLLAYAWRETSSADRLAPAAVVVGVVALGLEKLAGGMPALLRAGVGQAPWALLCLGLVHYGSRGLPGSIGRLLRVSPLLHVGKTSYAIYLFHPFVAENVVPRLGIETISTSGVPRFVVVMSISIGAAAVSWRFLEQPLNALKERFPYARTAREPVSGLVSP